MAQGNEEGITRSDNVRLGLEGAEDEVRIRGKGGRGGD